jgi:alcohol dehydrogenase (cytochrome c)
MKGNWLYFLAPDGWFISLDAQTGKERWRKKVADEKMQYFTTGAPMVVGNHVIVGVGGDAIDVPGYLEAHDPETGELQWRWNSEPGKGEPGSETWPDEAAMSHGGGMTWLPGTYDKDLNLLYWGTGNANPVMAGQGRKGADLWTCSIVALNADTGKLVWYFQGSPHDTHDWDNTETPVLFDAQIDGKPRKLLAQAARNGYFFVLDRTDGKSLLTVPFGPVDWSLGVDKQGRPIPNPAKEPAPDGRLIAPDEGGMANFRSPSFDPKTGLFIVSAHPSYSLYFAKPADGTYGWAGADYDLWGKGVIEAIDYQTGKIRWTHDLGPGSPGAGVMTTVTGLTFTGDVKGNFLALDTSTGKTLWHSGSGGRISVSPISYELNGRQYLVNSSGGVVFAWTLPPAANAGQ